MGIVLGVTKGRGVLMTHLGSVNMYLTQGQYTNLSLRKHFNYKIKSGV